MSASVGGRISTTCPALPAQPCGFACCLRCPPVRSSSVRASFLLSYEVIFVELRDELRTSALGRHLLIVQIVQRLTCFGSPAGHEPQVSDRCANPALGSPPPIYTELVAPSARSGRTDKLDVGTRVRVDGGAPRHRQVTAVRRDGARALWRQR